MPTQAERTAATRRALLDATIGALVDLGYAGTGTAEICRRAGVSQGALFRHFPSKGALLAATAADVFPRIIESYRAAAASSGRRNHRAGLVALLFDAYDGPELLAAAELYTAARTDTDLAAALALVEPAHRARLHALAAELLPDLAADPRFAGTVDLVVDAVQGFATGRKHVLDAAATATERRRLERTLVAVLDLTPHREVVAS